MKKIIRKNLSAFLLAISIIVPLTSCGGGGSTSENIVDQVVNVTVFDKYVGSAVTVELYDSNNNLAGSAITDEKGQATIQVNGYQEYNIKVDTDSTGFYLDQEYKTSTSGEEITVNCNTTLIADAAPANKAYEVGSIMHDFTYTTNTGETKTASDLLKEYDAIFLNIWYVDCMYCVQEFPLIENAYKAYGDRVAFVALDPYDPVKDITAFKNTHKLTFDMGQDTPRITDKFANSGLLTGFPFTALIDKYGVVADSHTGAFQSALDFDLFFQEVLAEDYVPEAIIGIATEEDAEDGRVLPNVDMPESSELEAAANGEGYDFSYYPETSEKDAPYSWPFVVSEDGESIKPSNYTIDNSFAIVYSDIIIPKNSALVFDYKSSTEEDCDILYVLLDGMLYAEISGESDGWQTCYPYVSLSKSEKHTLTFIYMKDQSSSYGEDTVYIKNLRFIGEDEITVPTYILRTCYKGQGITGNHLFTNPVYNEEDGYYHVDKVDGPLILASLLRSTYWNEYTLLDIAQNGLLTDVNGKDYTEIITRYAGYAVNGGYELVPVTQELKEALDAIGQAYPMAGFGSKEWLFMCHYYSAYGTNGEEFPDPIAGLAPFSAYEAKLGKNVINYSTTIVPRGKYCKFVPEVDGVYKVYTEYTYTGDATVDASLSHATLGWILDAELNFIAEGLANGRENFATGDLYNSVMFSELKAGETYYILCAYEDLYRYTDLTFNVEYVGESYDFLKACSPGYFTTEGVDEEGNMVGDLIHGGINAIMGEDGYYHHLKEDGTIGSIIYCDFIYSNGWINASIFELIEAKYFDFTKDEDGNEIAGEDLTEEISAYIEIINVDENSELFGMVPVDAELAEILQKFVDVHGFYGVDQSWLKFCYYYEHYGA